MSISKLTVACALLLSAMTMSVAPLAHAADDAKKSTNNKPTQKPAHKSAHKAAAKAETTKVADPELDEPDTTGSASVEFKCELGNQVTVYTNPSDDTHIALRWKKRVHRLDRVGTSTGANRFENRHYGLVWIGIPAKSMLLDSKLSRQLANECRSDEQIQAEVTVTLPQQKS
jgi:hypothetical protein